MGIAGLEPRQVLSIVLPSFQLFLIKPNIAVKALIAWVVLAGGATKFPFTTSLHCHQCIRKQVPLIVSIPYD
jgi:hypothetical protein